MKWSGWVLAIVLASAQSIGAVGEDKHVKPGETYENKRPREVEYLVLELQPGEVFDNKTSHVFMVMDKERLFGFDLESRISSHQRAVTARLEELEQLERGISNQKAERQKHQTEEGEKR
ncbi:MAG: hypothetical protein ACE5IY_19630 [bacterium]